MAKAINQNFKTFFQIIEEVMKIALKSSTIGIQRNRKTTWQLILDIKIL